MNLRCKCSIAHSGKNDRYEYIVFCPLHTNADKLLTVLKEIVAVPNKVRPQRVWDEAQQVINKAQVK